MSAALALLAFLGCGSVIVWAVSRKAAHAEMELKYAKEYAKRQASAAEVLCTYANLNVDELSERVHKKREAAKQRMHN